MRPGDPIGHRSATRGLKVQGIDQGGVWYNATVKEVAADNSRVLLTFTGFGASHNRWHTLSLLSTHDSTGSSKELKEIEMGAHQFYQSAHRLRVTLPARTSSQH